LNLHSDLNYYLADPRGALGLRIFELRSFIRRDYLWHVGDLGAEREFVYAVDYSADFSLWTVVPVRLHIGNAEVLLPYCRSQTHTLRKVCPQKGREL
jgi:hypothetical protein